MENLKVSSFSIQINTFELPKEGGDCIIYMFQIENYLHGDAPEDRSILIEEEMA